MSGSHRRRQSGDSWRQREALLSDAPIAATCIEMAQSANTQRFALSALRLAIEQGYPLLFHFCS